ncbi:hypothetical protein AAF712_015835 [Marasmius tenuissimus]|uniref:Uncharacterized protein n=1 Tax=Marasmius tenuissimus TaxID=585030 RepID=A0ABR2Z9E2_9AGAR
MSARQVTLLHPTSQPAVDPWLLTLLNSVLDEHPELQSPESRILRAGTHPWLTNSQPKFLASSDVLGCIYDWFHLCLHIDTEFMKPRLDPRHAVNIFLSIQVQLKQRRSDAALADLLYLQTYVVKGLAQVQHNPTSSESLLNADDLGNPEIDSDPTDNCNVGDNTYADGADSISHPAAVGPNDLPLPSTSTKPPKKKAKQRVRLEDQNFAEICHQWHVDLEGILKLELPVHRQTDPAHLSNPSDFSDSSPFTYHIQIAIDALREMRKVLCAKSKLANDILRISHPAFYVEFNSPHNERLIRAHAIGVALGWELDKWSESLYRCLESPVSPEYPDISPAATEAENRAMAGGKIFIDALHQNPTLIPTAGNPASVFFLCSEANFVLSWHRWLKWHLSALKYEVSGQNPPTIYRLTFQYLNQVQERAVEDAEYLQSLRGAGITLVPPGEQMRAKQRADSEGNSIAKIVSAENLSRIAANSDILRRCRRQIIVIEDQDYPGKMVDFVFFNPFPPEELKLLIEHHNTSSDVRPLIRGGQFKFFSTGTMTPSGSRVATGGNAADGYVAYAGITAETADGINILFNHTESSMMLFEAAKLVNPDLVEDHYQASACCDCVGLSGTNLYVCNDYTATLHSDDDAVRSLSCQLVKNVDTKYDEYGFANLTYGYYIATTANMLWSSDAHNVHGTILPSQQTVDSLKSTLRLQGGASRGDHATVTTRNKLHAERDEAVCRNYNLRKHVWDRHIADGFPER